MAWLCLLLAGCCEVIGVMGINRWHRSRNMASLLVMSGGFVMSFALLTIAMRSISMGTAYAIWTAIGTVGGAVVGMIFYGESRNWQRMLFIGMVVCSAVGLKLFGH
jgi:paired small multidrug resistance pump